MHKHLTIGLALMVVASLLTGCAGAPPTGAPSGAATKPSELRIAMVLLNPSPSLDPAQTSFSNPEFANMYEGLTEFGRDGKIEPALATEWRNLDPVTWEFKLRQGVKFHNGEEFNAEAAKFTLDRIREPDLKSPMVPFFSNVKEVQVVDDYTIKVITSEPYVPLPARIQRLFMVPPKLVKDVGAAAFADKPVGTGPYKFVEWAKGERFILEAFEGYWKGPAKIKKLTFTPAPEASTRIAKLLNNEADLIEGALISDVPRLEADQNVKVLKVISSYVNFVAMPTDQKPYDDKRVRQAMNYAVDVDSIIAKVMGGHAQRVSISNAPTNIGYDASLQPYLYDAEKAKALLQEAGYSGSFPPQELDVGQGAQPYNVDVAEAIAGYLSTAGMPTKVTVMERSAQFQKYVGKKVTGLTFQATLNALGDSDAILSLNFETPPRGRGLYYNSPRMDELLQKARGTFNPEERNKVYAEISTILREDAPHIVLYTVGDVYAARKNVEWEPESSRNMFFWAADVK